MLLITLTRVYTYWECLDIILLTHKCLQQRRIIKCCDDWCLVCFLLHLVQQRGAWMGWPQPSTLITVPNITVHP